MPTHYSPTRSTQEARIRGAPNYVEAKTRTKNGCLTCRLRRKRCDEGKNPGCDSCHRLRIQCLGYSPARPSWMRDPKILDECRNSIKLHLIQSGMVMGKGQSSSNYDTEQVLCLDDIVGTHSPPPSPSPPASSDDSAYLSSPPRSITPDFSFDILDTLSTIDDYVFETDSCFYEPSLRTTQADVDLYTGFYAPHSSTFFSPASWNTWDLSSAMQNGH